MFPVSKLPALRRGKEETVGLIELFGTNSEIPFTIEEISGTGFLNKYIRLDESTLRVAPWCTDDSLAMVFYDTYETVTETPWPFNPRLLARLKLKELEDNGYKLLLGVENEFRLFNKSSRQPIFNNRRFASQYMATTMVLPFVRNLNNRLKREDIEIDSWNMEYGKAQVEIPLKAYIGLEGLDKVWIFRELCKYVANDMDLIASFMTIPLASDVGSGTHVNHSLLRSADIMNAMQSDKNDGKLSEIGENWLAGLMKHSRALSAFTSQTVNCYRRVRVGGWAPQMISWNYTRRDVAYRIKQNANNCVYIENRTPSSSCNIYLVVAGMIVAGLDGIKNDLKLIAPGNGEHCGILPVSLEEALIALGDDSVMREGLGNTFVEWYIKAKLECDVKVLRGVDLDCDTPAAIEQEVEKYFML